jgi:polysaccharide chain length determinant protein (PEP-CTERM system associated)
MATKAAVFLNIHVLLAAAWRRRYIIILPMLVLPVLSTLMGAFTPKQFLNHTTILIQETSKLNPFLSDFAVSTQLNERMAALEALLHSRHMLLAVAEELDLIDSTADPRVGAVISQLSQALTVRLIGNDMIKISYKSFQSADMANVLVVVTKHFLDNLLAPERSSLNATEGFLEGQLTLQLESLKVAEQQLALFKAENSARLPDQYQFDVAQLRKSEELLREKETLLVGVQARVNSLRSQLLKTNPLLATVEENLLFHTSEMTLLKTRYTDRHSLVVSLQRKINKLKLERDDIIRTTALLTEDDVQQLWNVATQFRLGDASEGVRPLLVSQMEAIETAKSHEQQLLKETIQLGEVISQVQTKIESFAGIEQQLNELERDINTKKTLYNDFLKRYELAKVTGALGRYEEGDRVKIIDQPFTPNSPINPSIQIYFIAGIFGGLFLGAGIALLLEISNTSIIRRDVLADLTGLPVITRIPRVDIPLDQSTQ